MESRWQVESCPNPSDGGSTKSADPTVAIVPVPKGITGICIPNRKQKPYTGYLIYGVRAIMVERPKWRSLKLPSSSQDSKSGAILYTKNFGDRQRDAKMVTSIISPFSSPAWPLWKLDGSRQVATGATQLQLLYQILDLYWNIFTKSLALGV